MVDISIAKMKVLLFDTETTGLPKTKASAKEGPNNWPHIVSISWAILDADTNVVEKTRSYIIKPNKWTIPESSTRIHGITTEHASEHGWPLKEVMDEFRDEPCDVMIAHNMSFDYNVIMNAILWDLRETREHPCRVRHCTMQLSRNLCKLPSEYSNGYKNPKLSELYRFVLKEDPTATSLHNSDYDTEILTKIVQTSQELRSQMGLPTIPVYKATNVHQAVPNKVLSLRLGDST